MLYVSIQVLNAVRKEVERWAHNAEASDLRHEQVGGMDIALTHMHVHQPSKPGRLVICVAVSRTLS